MEAGTPALALAGCVGDGMSPIPGPADRQHGRAGRRHRCQSGFCWRCEHGIANFLSSGAGRLSGDGIASEPLCRTLDEGGWTWNVNGDGTASSRTDDGSGMPISNWRISGNRCCRLNSGESTTCCSNIRVLGRACHFPESDNPDAMNGWSVAVQSGAGGGSQDAVPIIPEGAVAGSGEPVPAVAGPA